MISQPAIATDSLFQTYLRPWKQYAVFSGRASRKEYWTFSLINFAVYIVLSIVPAIIDAGNPSREPNPFTLLAQLLYLGFAVAAFIPGLAVSVRRLHDTDRSGWWLIPCMICGIILLVFGLQEGDHGPNQYGPDPYDDGSYSPYSLTPPPPNVYGDFETRRPVETWRTNDGE